MLLDGDWRAANQAEVLVSGFWVLDIAFASITWIKRLLRGSDFALVMQGGRADACYTWAVVAISLIGFFNISGALASGFIGQGYSKAIFLSLIYIGRSIAVTLFSILPASPTSIVAFSVVIGLLWLSTVQPTNALVAVMFGTHHFGMLGGIVFFSHQVGSFPGVRLGGVLYDQTG